MRSSQDGFANDLGTGEVPFDNLNFFPYTVFLPKAAFTGVAVPITFRIYTYVPMGAEIVYYDEIQVFGAIDTSSPPVVSIRGKKKVITTKSALTIKGTVVGLVTAVIVKQGKRTYSAKGTTLWSYKTKKLDFGKNKLTVFAVGPGGSSIPAKITITHTSVN